MTYRLLLIIFYQHFSSVSIVEPLKYVFFKAPILLKRMFHNQTSIIEDHQYYLTTYIFRKGFYTINNCIDDNGCASIFNTLSGVISGILTHLSLSSSQIDYSNFTSFDRTFRNYCGESKTSIF